MSVHLTSATDGHWPGILVRAEEFAEAAQAEWVDATVNRGPFLDGMVVSIDIGAEMYVEAILTIDDSEAAFMSVQASTRQSEAIVVAWFRNWLGSAHTCVMYEDDDASAVQIVEYGTTAHAIESWLTGRDSAA